MNRTAVLLIFIAAIGIGSVLYLVGGSSVALGQGEVSGYRHSASPFENHLAEAVADNPRLAKCFDQLKALKARQDELSMKCESYQAHIDQYFREAGETAMAVTDSSLRMTLEARILAEKDTMTAYNAALSQSQNKLEHLVSRAVDLANAMKVLASMKHLRLWAGPNQPESKELDVLADEYGALVREWGDLAVPARTAASLP